MSVPSSITKCLIGLLVACASAPGQQVDPTHTMAGAPSEPATSYLYQLSPETKGDLLMARRQYVAAIDAYRHASLMSSLVWTKIGVAYHHLFALDEAMKDYQVALHLDAHNADALNNMGAAYHGKRDYGNAAKYYRKALRYSPRSAAIYCNLGTTYFAARKYRDAEKAYGHAFAIDPRAFNHDPNATVDAGASREERIAQHYYLARTFARAGQQAEALAYLRKAFDEGFHDRRRLEGEQDFSMLRTTLEFKQLMAQQVQQ